MSSYRKLTDVEKDILDKLLDSSFPGRDELKKQVESCMAVSTDDPDNYGSIYLRTSIREKAKVSTRVPVEGRALDIDGGSIDILLHVINGELNELEIFRADGSPLQSSINPTSMNVLINEQ